MTARFCMIYQSHAHTVTSLKPHMVSLWFLGVDWACSCLRIVTLVRPSVWTALPQVNHKANLSILQASAQMSFSQTPAVLFATTSDPKSVLLLLNQTWVHLPTCNEADLLTWGRGEGKCSIHYRCQAEPRAASSQKGWTPQWVSAKHF